MFAFAIAIGERAHCCMSAQVQIIYNQLNLAVWARSVPTEGVYCKSPIIATRRESAHSL